MVTSWSPHAPRGHLVVTSWSPPGHLMVTPWSPRGHLVVTPWSPRGHPECLSVVICQRFDPYKLGDCASWSHIWRPPAPYRFFLRRTLDPYGGTRGKSHVYIPPEISDPKIVPSTPRVHPEYTCSPPLALPLSLPMELPLARVRGVEPRVAVLETAVLPLH